MFGEHAATGIHIGFHPIDRIWVWDEGPTCRAGGVHLRAATIEQDNVVLVQVRLAVPKIRRGIRERRGAAADLIARVSSL